MPKSHALEETLTALGRLRHEPVTDRTVATLRQALGAKVSHVVAKAAQVIGELPARPLLPDLGAAFERLLTNPLKTDPGCRAKLAIAHALYELGEDPGSVFARGIRHRQLEPVFGGRDDTAAELRAVCAMGLVRVGHPETMTELADLLADPVASARSGAARAIAHAEDGASEPLLRLKALAGDADPEVVSECLAGLLSLAGVRVLAFVERFLDHADPIVQEAAAVALGASRLRAALPILQAWRERTVESDLRRSALFAIAMLRHDDALAFLVTLVASAPGPDARDALAALGTYRHDEALRPRVAAAVDARTDVDLRAAFAKAF